MNVPMPTSRDSGKKTFSNFMMKEGLEPNSSLAAWLSKNWDSLDSFEVKDSLKRHAEAWNEVTNSEFIIGVINDGYKPPFVQKPSPSISKNNHSAFQNQNFVLKSVGEGLKNGCLKLVKERPTVVNPMSVSIQNNGKKRLICDLRHVNKFLRPQKFKLDDWPRAIPSLSPGMYAFTFDLQKGYYHVNLHPEVQQFFGISFKINGDTYYAVYTVGPFGLSTLPHLFTKLLKPWVAKWRGMGCNAFIYLDDGFIACHSLRSALFFSQLIRSDFRKAGVIDQPEKCNWEPKQQASWIGLDVDFVEFCIMLPKEKVQKSLEIIEEALAESASPRTLLKAAGKIISFALVLGKECLIKTKPLFSFVSSLGGGNKNWDQKTPLSSEVRDCLKFWRDYLPNCSIKRSLQKNPVSTVIFSDASSTGGAAFIEARAIKRLQDQPREDGHGPERAIKIGLSERPGKAWRNQSGKAGLGSEKTTKDGLPDQLGKAWQNQSGKAGPGSVRAIKAGLFGQPGKAWQRTGITQSFPNPLEDKTVSSRMIALSGWGNAETGLSSTWREVKTIDNSLKAWGPQLKGEHIKWFTDNLGGVSVVRKGSMVENLNLLADSIDRTCKKFGIELELKWVRREENKVADRLSRFVDLDDWGIEQKLLRWAWGLWGKCSIDRFASNENNKLRRFNSRFSCEGSEAVDAFAQEWKDEHNLLVPPPSLIPEVIRHLVHSGARGVLIAPAWKSAKFWPLLFPEGGEAWFLRDFRIIRGGGRFIEEGKQPNSIFTPKKFKGDLLMAYVNAEQKRKHGYS
ncbi:MAG: hypothetical protein GY696_24710 [Gammaproteobacteria bacterium]|nr:hypothetical protein [Gammaproteobacteria bacterium]